MKIYNLIFVRKEKRKQMKQMLAMFKLAWGKIRRFYYHKFNRSYVIKAKEKRHGECARCGTCCKLLFKCPFLDETQTPSMCKVHNTRPFNCRIFPVDRADIADKNLVDSTKRCGYYFESEKK